MSPASPYGHRAKNEIARDAWIAREHSVEHLKETIPETFWRSNKQLTAATPAELIALLSQLPPDLPFDEGYEVTVANVDEPGRCVVLLQDLW